MSSMPSRSFQLLPAILAPLVAGGPAFVAVDWDGNVLREYSEPRESYHPHHDDLRIYNAALGEYTRLYIANVDMSHDEVIALGADPTRAERYDGVQMDAIVEVDREGNVVWEYVSPVTAADGIVTTVITSMHTNILGGWSPFRYAPHHPGLAGKDLSPKGPITEFHAGTD